MSHLIYRDWMLIKRTKIIYFGLFYLFYLIPNASNDNFMFNYSTNFIFIFVAYLFFSYLTSYDYKYNGLAFACALPVSKRDIVVSRYLFLAMSFLAYLIFLIAVKALIAHFYNGGDIVDYKQLGIFLIIFSVFMGTIIPLYYKIGYQRMRWVMFIGMFASVIISGLLQESGLAMNNPAFTIEALAAGALIYYLSIELSCRIVNHMDL